MTLEQFHREVHPAIHLTRDFETYRPGYDELIRQFERNFVHRGIPKSQPMRELNVEIVLGPAQMQRGGRIPIDVPVAQLCPRCDSTGQTGFFACDLCDGHGMTWQTAHVEVLVSPRTPDGAIIPVSLRHVGVSNLFLNVHIRLVT